MRNFGKKFSGFGVEWQEALKLLTPLFPYNLLTPKFVKLKCGVNAVNKLKRDSTLFSYNFFKPPSLSRLEGFLNSMFRQSVNTLLLSKWTHYLPCMLERRILKQILRIRLSGPIWNQKRHQSFLIFSPKSLIILVLNFLVKINMYAMRHLQRVTCERMFLPKDFSTESASEGERAEEERSRLKKRLLCVLHFYHKTCILLF